MSITAASLAVLLGKRLLPKTIALLRNGGMSAVRVRKNPDGTQKLSAPVEDARGNIYHTEITLNGMGAIAEGDCTCGSLAFCPHRGAVLAIHFGLADDLIQAEAEHREPSSAGTVGTEEVAGADSSSVNTGAAGSGFGASEAARDAGCSSGASGFSGGSFGASSASGAPGSNSKAGSGSRATGAYRYPGGNFGTNEADGAGSTGFEGTKADAAAGNSSVVSESPGAAGSGSIATGASKAVGGSTGVSGATGRSLGAAEAFGAARTAGHNSTALIHGLEVSGDTRYTPVYRLAFCLEWKEVLKDSPIKAFVRQLMVYPVLQFVRRNGTAGRIERYNRNRTTEPAAQVPTAALDLILSESPENREMETVRIMDILAALPDGSLFYHNNKQYYPVNHCSADRIAVEFRFFNLQRNRPQFYPVISFFNGTEKYQNDLHEILSEKNRLFSVIHSNGNYFLCHTSSDSTEYGTLHQILTYRPQMDLEALKKIAEQAESLRIPDMEFNIPVNEIREVDTAIEPHIQVFPDGENTFTNLVFHYNGKVLQFDEEFFYNKFDLEREPSETEWTALEQSETEWPSYLCLDDNHDYLITRRKQIEESRIHYTYRRLLDDLLDDWYANGRYTSRLKCSMRHFLGREAIRLMDAGFTLELGDKKVHSAAGAVQFRVHGQRDWLQLQVFLPNSSLVITNDIIESRIIPSEGGYHILSREDAALLADLLRQGMSSKGELKISRYNISLIDELYSRIREEDRAGFTDPRDKYRKLKEFETIPQVDLPECFHGRLRPYQQGGLNWLFFLHEAGLNGCLADDMGLGKTVQTLALLSVLAAGKSGVSGISDIKVLIIAPVSTLPNWEREVGRFTPHLEVKLHKGRNRMKDQQELWSSRILLTSYSTLRNDIEYFAGVNFDYVILDEAQNIKNSRSRTFKVARALKADHQLALSGTPIENHTGELWSLMEFLNPGLLGTLSDFRKKYSRSMESETFEERSEALRKIIYPFILRRHKEDVASDLPPKEEIDIYLEMGHQQKEAYKAIRDKYRDKVEQEIKTRGFRKASVYILEALLRLRQAALFPHLADDNFTNTPSCKLEKVLELLEEIIAENHKVLIFSQFVSILNILEPELHKRSILFTRIDGSTTDRGAQIDTFNNNKSVSSMLISLRAGGVGINLTAADYVILFDPWWNPAVEAQAIDRSHRIGQTRKVFAYRLIVRDTVEEKIRSLQESKRLLADEIITREKSFVKALEREDLEILFS